MGCRYIYSIYDAKSGALVAKGDAAKLVGLGLFRDAGVLSTSYHKNRECKRPRKYRIEQGKSSEDLCNDHAAESAAEYVHLQLL